MVSNATCGVCHAPLPPDALVCPHCGHPVGRAPLAAASAADSAAVVPETSVIEPPPWAPLPAPAATHAAGNGSAPAADAWLGTPTSASDPGVPVADAPLPVRSAGTLGTTKLDMEPGPALAAGSVPFAPPAAGPLAADSAWLSGQSSLPPAPAAVPAPLPAPPRVEPLLVPVPTGAAPVVVPAVAAATPPPSGALVLLRGEEVIMQLGALYLTNKRAILYAPTILRAAYLRDIDAIGTVTERSSGWMLLLGLLGLGLAAAAAYIGATQPGLEFQIGDMYHASPLLLAIPLALIGVLTLASYFFWVKRSLFLSVGGRPLIVVSLSGWSGKKLTAVDSFVNAFSQAKEAEGP